MAYVYILKCIDGSFYTGSTTDIKKRIKNHVLKSSAAAKYTRSHTIQEVAAIWEVPTYSTACKIEYYIKKKLTHTQKQALVEIPNDLYKFLNEELLKFDFSYFGKINTEEIKLLAENNRQNGKQK